MKKTGRHITVLAVLLLGTIPVLKAQNLLWKVDMTGFFDNREYKSPYQTSQTFFGTRLSPEIGLGIDKDRHRIMVGGSWIQSFGSPLKDSEFKPTVYYQYSGRNGFSMNVGSFARTHLIESLPAILLYDSLTYFRPNIEGVLFQYQRDRGYGEVFIDWRRKQTEQEREAFLISASGRWMPGIFFAGGHAVMNHLARPKNSPDDISVVDDILLNPYVGIDLRNRLPLDDFSLQVGYVISLERIRSIGTWHRPQGMLAQLSAEWRFIGLNNILYIGDNQQPFYPQFGSLLNQGDPFYQSTRYNRTDLYAYLFRNRWVNCFFSLNFHYSKESFDTQQQFILRFDIDNYYKKPPRRPPKRSLLKDLF